MNLGWIQHQHQRISRIRGSAEDQQDPAEGDQRISRGESLGSNLLEVRDEAQQEGAGAQRGSEDQPESVS